MNKLTLDLNALAVESFETFVPDAQRGTVRANSGCVTFSCPPGTCGIAPQSELERLGPAAVSFKGNCCA